MEDLCRFFIYFILFLTLYQYFNKVVEGHNVQSSSDCSSAQNRTDCRTKAPSCYWSDASGKRTSGGNGTCVSTGSTVSASRYHSGNHHASDHNHPTDPSITQISGRVEDSGENQINLSGRAMCDTHTCPNNYVKRNGIDNVFQGEDATQTCCRPVTCDTFECGQTSDPIDNSSTVNQFDPPEAPTELPGERCCTPKICNTYTCPSGFQSKPGLENLQQGGNPQSTCCYALSDSHREAGMCSNAQPSTSQNPNYNNGQPFGGPCQRSSCNFCCGISAQKPDGTMNNYGQHCREWQCGSGSNPSTMVASGLDQKENWTDCLRQ